MAITQRQLVTALSIVYLLLLTLLAIYALHSARTYALPIPNLLSALTLALPALSGLLIETSTALLTPPKKTSTPQPRPLLHTSPLFLALLATLLVFETSLATLAGTHILPAAPLNCGLQETWQTLFHEKDAERVRAIQDGFRCCGFNSPRDRAFPFPDRAHRADACVRQFERAQRCLEPWRAEERRVGGMLLGVAVGVFLWKMLMLALPLSSLSTSWLPSAICLPGDSNTNDNSGRHRGNPRQIGYRDAEEASTTEEDSLAGEVRRLNNDSQLASQVEGGRVRPSALMSGGGEEWRRNVGGE